MAALGLLQLYVSLTAALMDASNVPVGTGGEARYRRGYCDALDFAVRATRVAAGLMADSENDLDRLLDVAMAIWIKNYVPERRCF